MVGAQVVYLPFLVTCEHHLFILSKCVKFVLDVRSKHFMGPILR